MQYVGSKRRISKEIVPIIQSCITKETSLYLEPFVGGANVIDKIQCRKKIGCDVHKQLISLLKQAQNDVSVFPESISEEEYINVKNNKEQYPDWYVGLVGFTATFGNKYFGGFARNKKGTDYSRTAINTIKKQSKLLKEIDFYNTSFLGIDPQKISNAVIYCDPPYRGTTKYKTDPFPYEDFYAWCKELSKNNIVLISEYNMPEEFTCIWEKGINMSMGSGINKSETYRVERLFTYNNK